MILEFQEVDESLYSGTTTGFVVWINRKGIMVDPPPYSTKYLKLYGM